MEREVARNARGRFSISGKRNVELDLGKNDLTKFAVIEKDMDPGLPGDFDGVPIQWIAAFGVRVRGKDKKLGGYASIEYTVFIDAIPDDSRLFAYYGKQVVEIKEFSTTGDRTRFKMKVGDPPIGFGP